MARKDFDSYFSKVTKQYQDLNKVLEDLSVEAEQGIIEPERLEQLRATIQPVKNSYDTLTYINYLLNKPTRKSKHTKYNRQYAKIKKATAHVSAEVTTDSNERIINGLKQSGNCI